MSSRQAQHTGQYRWKHCCCQPSSYPTTNYTKNLKSLSLSLAVFTRSTLEDKNICALTALNTSQMYNDKRRSAAADRHNLRHVRLLGALLPLPNNSSNLSCTSHIKLCERLVYCRRNGRKALAAAAVSPLLLLLLPCPASPVSGVLCVRSVLLLVLPLPNALLRKYAGTADEAADSSTALEMDAPTAATSVLGGW